ncbi:MAG: hypothetical protein ABSD30_16235 [Candidatus Binatus sp.]|jgi:hypothetical protein
MSADPGQVIAQELEAGESLLWSGQPRKGIVFRGSDVFMIPFSLLWGGGAIAFLGATLSQYREGGAGGPGFVGLLFGIPFLLLALYIVFGRFIVDAIQRDHTCYGVTSHRVIIVTGLVDRQPAPDVAMVTALVALFSPRKVKSLDLRTMSDISMTERLGGSGTITFGPPNPYQYLSGTWWPGMHVFTPSFDLIEQVKSVYRVIRDAQQQRWPAGR